MQHLLENVSGSNQGTQEQDEPDNRVIIRVVACLYPAVQQTVSQCHTAITWCLPG